MKRIETLLARVLVAGLLALTGSIGAVAQDALAANPKTLHVRLDNDRVRVLEATLQPGDKEQMHSHPASIVYVIVGGRIRNHGADGKTTESVLKAGDVLYRDPLTHWAENIDKAQIRLIVVELKSPK